ncbi:DUF305 domain-containing protein [Catellatospora coxensis]|uniref:DUF305 domain-containing protein n=1 Tax=Catellatospora coxensis TaxID=310354 RepID=A0A8J3L9A3_9ACTN|nr:DUF305 domain-containing protein [Catellatospora coxensis]GIG10821.1 DUF305 domain-containing protein [Catellatospora coxensis]
MTDVGNSPRFSTRGLALAVALALLVGLAIGFGVSRLAAAGSPADDSAAAGFARDMTAHHAQAVAMGMIAAKKGNSHEVRTIGEDIALTQQGQIGIMGQWLRDWGLNLNSTAKPMAWMPDGDKALNGNLMPGMATAQEMAALENATGKEVDRLFLEMMIKHHLGGVHMIDGVLEQTDDPGVLWLAKGMKTRQQIEISDMQQLQATLAKR